MPIEFALLSSQKLNALPREQTVFFFPVGPLEDHGPHLPMGLDLFEAEALCRRAGERLERELIGWTGVLMPTAPLGIESNTNAIALTVRAHVLRDWLVDACKSLSAMDFYHFVCFSGHLGPKQLTAIEEAGKKITRRPVPLLGLRRGRISPSLVSATSALIGGKEVLRSPFTAPTNEHGGARDTSVALALGGDRWVDPAFRALPEIKPTPSVWKKIFSFGRDQSGYRGNPAGASVEEGTRILAGNLDQVFPKLRAVWEGANANALFRSWYSIIPFHKSFYRAWILIFLIFTLVLGWIYISLNNITR